MPCRHARASSRPEAYVRSEGAEPDAPPPQKPGGGKPSRAGRRGNGAGALEDELAAAAAAAAAGRDEEVPDWVRQLQAEGFDVRGRGGELFLQRGGGGGGGGPPAAAGGRAAACGGGEVRSAGTQGARAAAAAAAAAGAGAFAVAPEFSATRWEAALAGRAPGVGAGRPGGPGRKLPSLQATFEEDDGEEEGGGGAAAKEEEGPDGGGAGWWLGTEMDAAAAAVLAQAAAAGGGGDGKAAGGAAQPQQPKGAAGGGGGPGGGEWQARLAAAARVRSLLARGDSPEAVLRLTEAAFPEWARNNGRLVHQVRRMGAALRLGPGRRPCLTRDCFGH
jgi:hypothetical protein